MKIKKIIIYSLLSLQLLVTFTSSKVFAQSILNDITETASSISPKVDAIDWQYKMIGENLYKRLYNYSTNTPLSDWQLVT